MSLNFSYLEKSLTTLQKSLIYLEQAQSGSTDYEVFRHAVIKGFELTLETAGKLLRKVLSSYVATPKIVAEWTYKDVLRHAAEHGLLTPAEVERWFAYCDSRNSSAHDYGEAFAEHILKLIQQFIVDAQTLLEQLKKQPNA